MKSVVATNEQFYTDKLKKEFVAILCPNEFFVFHI
jgi:hypothetical protein